VPGVTPFRPFGPACQPTGFCEAEVCSAWVVQVTCRLWCHAVVAGCGRRVWSQGVVAGCGRRVWHESLRHTAGVVVALPGLPVGERCLRERFAVLLSAFIQLFLQPLQGCHEQGRQEQGLALSSHSLTRRGSFP